MKKILFLLTVILLGSCSSYTTVDTHSKDSVYDQLTQLNSDTLLIKKQVPIVLQGTDEFELRRYESDGKNYKLVGKYQLLDYYPVIFFGLLISIVCVFIGILICN